MEQDLSLFQRILKKFKKEVVIETKEDLIPVFDKKYKFIIRLDSNLRFQLFQLADWLNLNSTGAVDIKSHINSENYLESIYLAFENYDDATFFKIKYSI